MSRSSCSPPSSTGWQTTRSMRSSWALTVYGAGVAAGAGLEVCARRPESRIRTLGALVEEVMRTRSGRVGLIAGWAWLGIHFSAR